MKLSPETISLLKNFSTINQSIFIKGGSELRTISVMKNIFAAAKVSEVFPKDFAIYDLNAFLNAISLHSSPDLDFSNDQCLTWKESNSSGTWYYADPSVIVSPPEKEIVLPSSDVCFVYSSSVHEKLMKAASVYQVSDLSCIGADGKIMMKVRDKKNDSSNYFTEVVGETDTEFCFNFKVENMKLLSGSYDVVVSRKLLAEFTSKSGNLKYFIALEPDSTYV
jgi:hypothetical protein